MAESKFEKDLERLEAIVQALEEGELSLDDSLKRFEEGIKLARRCEKSLTEAEKKIEILTKNADGSLEAQPFGEEGEKPEEPAARKTNRPKKATTAEPEGEEGDEEDGELLF